MCIHALVLFGGAVRIAGILASCAVALGLFVPSLALVPADLVEEVLVIVLDVYKRQSPRSAPGRASAS